MPGFEELDNRTTLAEQLNSGEEGPVVLMNLFTVAPSDVDQLVASWKHDAEFMKLQPGYVSTQLHRGIAGGTSFVNLAVWESVESFNTAFTNPEFQKRIKAYPPSAVSKPHLLKKLAVPGLCVA